MSKSIENLLSESNINFPKYWSPEHAVSLFLTTDSEDLAEELHTSPAILKVLLKEIFPSKPKPVSINKYLKGILATSAPSVPEVEDEFTTRQEKFMKIYKKGFFNKGMIAALSEEDQRKYRVFAEGMEDEKAYNNQ